jgi:hypothetical protein
MMVDSVRFPVGKDPHMEIEHLVSKYTQNRP